MPYRIDDETLNLIIDRVSEKIRTNTLGSHHDLDRNGNAEDAALRADIAARVAKFTDKDLHDALIRATQRVWARGFSFDPEQAPEQASGQPVTPDNVVARDP